jgi:hypothetical protein
MGRNDEIEKNMIDIIVFNSTQVCAKFRYCSSRRFSRTEPPPTVATLYYLAPTLQPE